MCETILFQFGERNNRYCQTKATIRKLRNFIWKVKDSQGNWFVDQERIS